MSPTTKVIWVKGYIVGMYTAWANNTFITYNFNNTGNVAIATSPTETDSIKTFQINFRDNSSVGKTILLYANPDNFGKKAYFHGDIEDSPQKSYGEGVVFSKIQTAIVFED